MGWTWLHEAEASAATKMTASSVFMMPGATRPNDQRSHAGPRTLKCNRGVLPALAAACGWVGDYSSGKASGSISTK